MRLEGRTAVVVGGNSGHGAASASRLASEGASVVVVDADADANSQVCDGIIAAGGHATAYDVDPGDPSQLMEVALQCTEAGHGVDILVNFYAMLDRISFEDTTVEAFERVIHHNVVGPVAASKAFLPLLKASGHGSIVHVSSIDGLYGNPTVPAYSASKGVIVPLTHVMAHELGKYDIRVNAVASGRTNQLTEEELAALPSGPGVFDREYNQKMNDLIPLKRFGTPEEWAGAVAFLASDDASYVTGAVIVVDCGRTGTTNGTT